MSLLAVTVAVGGGGAETTAAVVGRDEATDEVGDAVEVREGVRERSRLADVGLCSVDFTVDLERDESRGRGDGMTFGAEVAGILRVGVVAVVSVCVFASRCETCDDEEDEFTLVVDVGLIERLRDAYVDGGTVWPVGSAGRGMKPKRVCMVVGGGARLVIDMGRAEPKQFRKSTSSSV